MRRRDFIALLGGTAATSVTLPLAARAQQPAMPVIGLLDSRASGDSEQLRAAWRQGLQDTGFVEGRNVAIEYRFAENQNDRLPALAANLVQRQVTVVAAFGTPASLAAKTATATIPMVFETGGNPIELGLVTSLSRPGGNVTGVTQSNVEVAPKRLELLHELLPKVQVMALLVDPTDSSTAKTTASEVAAAAQFRTAAPCSGRQQRK